MTDGSLAEVQTLEDRRCAAVIAADTTVLGELLADEMVYTHSSGTLDTKDSFLKALTEKRLDYRSIERFDGDARLLGDTALFTGRAELHVVAPAREIHLNVRYSAVWARAGGRWQFLCWQSTLIPA